MHLFSCLYLYIYGVTGLFSIMQLQISVNACINQTNVSILRFHSCYAFSFRLIWQQSNWKMAITIENRFDLTRFRIDLSECILKKITFYWNYFPSFTAGALFRTFFEWTSLIIILYDYIVHCRTFFERASISNDYWPSAKTVQKIYLLPI